MIRLVLRFQTAVSPRVRQICEGLDTYISVHKISWPKLGLRLIVPLRLRRDLFLPKASQDCAAGDQHEHQLAAPVRQSALVDPATFGPNYHTFLFAAFF
jgi:hypothetical protein